MDKRKHIGILFNYNEGWIGGTYYLLNLIHALNTLPDARKPTISVITGRRASFRYLESETGYPYLHFVKNKSEYPLWAKAINAFSLRLLKKKLIDRKLAPTFDLLFPNPFGDYFSRIDSDRQVFWIPDFQEHYLPELFSDDELVTVKQRQVAQAYKARKIVFSSQDAKNDFQALYPRSKAAIHVIPFSVTHPDLNGLSAEVTLAKFGIDRPFFFSPNQFWVHKNQQLVVDAVQLLVDRGEKILVVFSGSETDHRSVGYATRLKQQVADAGLQAHIRFLGFIDRKEQLLIMQQARAVVQPSLFEGWSTVVEDAKALNKAIILSDLRVHREQLSPGEAVQFFNPQSAEELAGAMQRMHQAAPIGPVVDYRQNKVSHAQAFCALLA